MKSVLKVYNINTIADINRIRQAVSFNDGVIACQINKEKSEVTVVYDDYFLTTENIIESLEKIGYTVI
jgi:copper chaperone